MTFRPILALLLAVAATCTFAQSAADLGAGDSTRKASVWPLTPTSSEAQAAQLSARFLTRFHYDAQPLDDAMSARIYAAYFKLLDGEKVFFTQADMAKFAPLKTRFDDAIKIFGMDRENTVHVAQIDRDAAAQRLNVPLE